MKAEGWGYQVYEEWDRRHDEPLDLAGELDDEEPAGDPFPEDDEAYNLQHFPRLSARCLYIVAVRSGPDRRAFARVVR